eukprot:TRINITY_DN3889_c0_g1_i2.p1 TRINITY_DN3889_c0_g1~~TRINITY_DN3889_c0_g1_i2.p1  ORF type:complete len:252 (-),score=41.19 TRINITY_DN3889_c0_g1_i2:251-907(-)
MMNIVIFTIALTSAAFGARELSQTVFGGQSAADAAALATGLFTFTDSNTFNVDNRNFSSAIASSQFAAADPNQIAGGSLSLAGVSRTVNGSQTSSAAGFADSLLLGFSAPGAGVQGQGASSVEVAATPTEAGLNATAATVARVNGPGTLLWQNEAGGVVNTSANGPAQYNFTTRYNATGVNPEVAELVNVRLVSNSQETGSALTICVGNSTNCGTIRN